MNAVINPFAPGAGTPPPELAGRERLRDNVAISLARIRAGKSAKSAILVGLRGVGKTVLLDKLRTDAEAQGRITVRAETPERRSLPALLAPQLRQALVRLSQIAKAKAMAERGLRALAGLAKALKVKYGDPEVGIDLEPEPGLADNGDIEGDLTAVLEQVGRAARQANTAVVLFLDEMQYLEENQFAAEQILTFTHEYPYFLQEWGKHSWNVASKSPITKKDVLLATRSAVAALDEGFFRVRFDRTTPKEKRYLRAMAELGSGPHRSGDIAAVLERPVSTVAPLRQSLIAKGMLWSPSHGDTAFTVAPV